MCFARRRFLLGGGLLETLLGLCCLATIEKHRTLKNRRSTLPKAGIDAVAAAVWWRSIEMEAIAMRATKLIQERICKFRYQLLESRLTEKTIKKFPSKAAGNQLKKQNSRHLHLHSSSLYCRRSYFFRKWDGHLQTSVLNRS